MCKILQMLRGRSVILQVIALKIPFKYFCWSLEVLPAGFQLQKCCRTDHSGTDELLKILVE